MSKKIGWFSKRVGLDSELAKALLQALEENTRLDTKLLGKGWPKQQLSRVQAWQSQRMQKDYADFLEHKQYQAAVNFFLTELYGNFNFIDRNHDLRRVYPMMVKLLPVSLLETLVEALRFQADSLHKDMALAENLFKLEGKTNASGPLSDTLYRQLNQACVTQHSRREQIRKVLQLGESLAAVADHSILLKLLKMMRMPARAAGFAVLQNFLETGLSAFQQMPDTTYFLAEIKLREDRFINGLYTPQAR